MKLSNFLKSFKYAERGIRLVLKSEFNFRFDMVVGVMVLLVAFTGNFSWVERALLVFATFFVLVVELFNSAFERIADLLEPRLHDRVAEIKDIMAGASLFAVICAVVVAAFIFLPLIF